MYIDNEGYMRLDINDNGKSIAIKEHQLNALINNPLKDVYNPDNVVHHWNEIPLDNRVENLKVMSRIEHNSLHNTGNKNSRFNYCIQIRKEKGKTCKQGFTWCARPSTKDKQITLSSVDLETCIKKVQDFINSEENTLGYTSYQVRGE